MSPHDNTAQPRWLAFIAVCVAYLATTTGEALLAPVLPLAIDDLASNLDDAGLFFAVLAISIAIANVAGGVLLRWLTADKVIAVALLLTAVGSAIAHFSSTVAFFTLSQVLLGGGAGLLYPAAIMSVGQFAGSHRRGFAMGMFGVFFSAGLTIAAGLATIGASLDWRWSFAISGLLAVGALTGILGLRNAPKSDSDGSIFDGLRDVLGLPTVVGVAGGISQYATVSFLPVFAVSVWGMSEASAAIILASGRIVSVPSKLFTGWLTDRLGSTRAAQVTGLSLGLLGAIWGLVPLTPIAVAAAIIFTAAVSGLFPIANTLAFERVGRKGGSLGIFRSVQIAAGAAIGVAISAVTGVVGLRTVIAVVGSLPILLWVVGHSHRK